LEVFTDRKNGAVGTETQKKRAIVRSSSRISCYRERGKIYSYCSVRGETQGEKREDDCRCCKSSI